MERNVPNIRFKGFSEEWKNFILGELGSVAMNKRIFKEQTSATGEVPFFKIGTFGGKPDAFISKAIFDEYKAKYPYPKAGDLLLSASGSIGRVVEYKGEEEYFQDSNIVWLKHDGKIDNSFLKVFYSIVKWSGLEGSTIKRLYNKNILDTGICVPNREEQTQIGNYFQELDKLISQHKQKHDKLNNIKKAMLAKMFPKADETVPEIRFKEFSGDWEEKELNEVANYRNGKAHEQAINSNGKFVVVNSKFVSTNGMVKKHSVQQISPMSTNEIAFVLSDIPNGKALARTFLINRDYLYTLNQRIAGITPDECTHHYFLHILLNRNPYFLKFDDGAKQTNLSVADVEQFKSLYPMHGEQTKIGNYFQELDKLINQHQQLITKLNNIKQACLTKMFV